MRASLSSHAHPHPRPLSQRERGALTAAALIGACLVIDAILLTYGLDELDEGYFAEQAMRVVRGDLPYRDFESLYTPGVLYLHAIVFKALGAPYLVAPRLIALAARAALAAGLYVLGRPLMPPLWAALPALFVLVGLDTIPAGWEPHPGWHSTALTLLATWLLTRVYVRAPPRPSLWLIAAGATGALVFLFKQNTGAFFVLAVVLLMLPRIRWLQSLAWAATLIAVVWLVRPYVDLAIALLLLSPLVSLGLVSVIGEVSLPLAPRSIVAFAGGFVVVTLCWVLPLVASLDGRIASLGGFVGAVEQANLYFPPQLPTVGAWVAVGLAGAALVALRADGRARGALLVASAAGLAAAVWLLRVIDEPALASVLLAPERIGFGIVSVLPTLAAWAGIWMAYRRSVDWRLRLYVFVGVFALLTQYPRMDTLHLAWSAPMLLLIGAYALYRAYEWLRARLPAAGGGSIVLACALVGIPVFAALPGWYLRAGAIFESSPGSGLPQRIPMLTLQRPATVAGIRVVTAMSWQLTDILDELEDDTAPSEAIFVYPSEPLLYVLADRRNPTRHSHVYPGLSSRDEQGIIASLEREQVRTVVVSDAWIGFWLAGGGNPVLETYLNDHFDEAGRFGVYRKLIRHN